MTIKFRRLALLVFMTTLLGSALLSLSCVDDGDPQMPFRQLQAEMQHMSLFASQIEAVSTSTDCSRLQEHLDSAGRFRESSITSKSIGDADEYKSVVDSRLNQVGCPGG